MIQYLIPPYLAICSRWHGSAIPTPKVLEATFYAAPYVAVSGYYMAQNGLEWVEYGALAACLVATIAAKNTGHADGFKDYVRDNPLSKIVSLLPLDRNSQAYDAVFFGLKGLLIASFTAFIAAYHGAYVLAASLALSSAIGYPMAYWLGYALAPRKRQTMTGELLGGFIAGLGFLAW